MKKENCFKRKYLPCVLKHRFIALVIPTIVGIAIFGLFAYFQILCYLFLFLTNERIITNLLIVTLSVPTFLILWVFRTHDTKKQLNKAQENIKQQDFHDALNMLADDKLISQGIAMQRLIKISEKNPEYNDTIKLAFIQRMKAINKEVKEVATEAGIKQFIQSELNTKKEISKIKGTIQDIKKEISISLTLKQRLAKVQ